MKNVATYDAVCKQMYAHKTIIVLMVMTHRAEAYTVALAVFFNKS